MSEMVAASAAPASAEGRSDAPRRRRRPAGGGGRRRGPRGGKKAEGESSAADGSAEDRPRREYKEVPAEMINQRVVGIVSVVVRKGRARFGFILIGEGVDADAFDIAPRIYFSFTNIKQEDLIMRRGYLVTFVCKKDDQDRPFADEIELTEEGKTIQVAREERIAQRKAENPEGAEGGGRQRRERGERPPPPEPRMVKLRVTCEGKGSDEKLVDVNAAQSVAKLKLAACAAFESSIDLNVYLVPASGLGDMIFMTRELKNELAENDRIHLAARKDDA